MIKEFTYPLPDELYIEGVSGKIKGSFTYDGPDSITVFLEESGEVRYIEPRITDDMDPNLIKQIDPEKDSAAAYLLNHYFLDDISRQYEFEDIEMENGDIYKNPINPDLTDAYELVYNFDKEEWELKQILRKLVDPAVPIAKERKEYVLKYYEKYDFGEDIDTKITEYLSKLDNIIDNPQLLMPWKYINIPKRDVPKIPLDIAAEFSKIPGNEV
jgi:hypothetical protein